MQLLIQTALSTLNKPYIWGGKSPLLGFDCSGLIEYILRSVGMDPAGIQNSQMLYDYFKLHGVQGSPDAGALVFYGKNLSDISHVAFMLDEIRVIEAGGGNETTISFEKSIEKNAYVRIRPYTHRPDVLAIIHPIYPDYVGGV